MSRPAGPATFGERVAEGFRTVYEGERVHAEDSPFQRIDVYEHPFFGRILTLDDLVQTTERDEFCYHEMLVHPALCALERPRRVLIIGGGDGGTLRRVLEHGVEEAVMCEIDEAVVAACREHLPSVSAGALDDPRARVIFGDGAAFVADAAPSSFDAILVDGSDPIGPAAVLFGREFFAACRAALAPGGIFVTQSGSPLFQSGEFAGAVETLSGVFDAVEPYLGAVPTYPGTIWSYTAATDGDPPSRTGAEVVERRLRERGVRCRYYTPAVHVSCFALPAIVDRARETGEPAPLPRS